MNNKTKRHIGWQKLTVLVSIYFYLSLLIFLLLSDILFNDEKSIWFFSVLGILIFIFINYSYKKNTEKIFDLYTITIWFMFLFNFGQCFAWAFNIHEEGEIGTVALFRYFIPDSLDIVKAQLVFLMCVVMFHGTVIFLKNKNPSEILAERVIYFEKKSLFLASKISALFLIPMEFYYTIRNYIQAKNYGYGSLYYGDLANQGSKIIAILDYAFFPCLVGLLIGGNYKKNVKRFVYFVFFIYMGFNLLSGDRGSWIYRLFILIWMHHTYYKKIKKKQFFTYSIISFILLHIVVAIVSVRNQGVTFESIMQALSFAKVNPVVSSLFEMGGSMGVNIVVIRDNIKYPLGNSYLLSFLGAISTKITKVIGIDYITLTRWFSQEYLEISWGAAFTIFSEGVVNFGIYLSPFIFIVYGIFFKKILNLERKNIFSPIKQYMYISIVSFFLNMIRNTMHDFLRGVIFGVLPLLILVRIIKNFNRRKYSND